jgi:hypothetical protein
MTSQLETEGVSSTVYAKALEDILGKPKVEASSLAKSLEVPHNVEELSENGEAVGFIHSHLNQVERLE